MRIKGFNHSKKANKKWERIMGEKVEYRWEEMDETMRERGRVSEIELALPVIQHLATCADPLASGEQFSAAFQHNSERWLSPSKMETNIFSASWMRDHSNNNDLPFPYVRFLYQPVSYPNQKSNVVYWCCAQQPLSIETAALVRSVE